MRSSYYVQAIQGLSHLSRSNSGLLRSQYQITYISRRFLSWQFQNEPVVDDKDHKYRNRTRVVIEMSRDEPGSLGRAISSFQQHNVNMTHIESRLHSFARSGPTFHIDFEGRSSDPKVMELLKHLREDCASVTILKDTPVPWFPVSIRELDLTKDILDGGTDLVNESHPGFHDIEYRARRNELAQIAQDYKHGNSISRIKYKENETQTWGTVYGNLKELHAKYACKEMLEIFPLLEKYCGYSHTNIPQLQDISDFLHDRTGFTLRPVQGLLSARDFLNALAFRVFFSTQYIRHHANPLYTPEPDICHELIGHVPLFADPNFAEFSHEIGLASLGASDAEIDALATNYWFTVEFGLCRENDQIKAYGAGLLSSFGEIEWACNPTPSKKCRDMGGMGDSLLVPEKVEYDPFVAGKQPFPITTYQPVLFVTESLLDAKTKIRKFCDSLVRPFFPQYDPFTQTILPSRAVKRLQRTSTAKLQAEKQKQYFQDKASKLATRIS